MRSEIYYFSGTGNSFIVARDIALRINAKLIPMASLLNHTDISSDADVIGFVFPIYASKQPRLVTKVVKKLKNLNSKYIFAAFTYGIVPANSIKAFDELIRSCGGELSMGYAVKMPHNGMGSSLFSEDQQKTMFDEWKTRVEVIGKDIIERKKGIYEKSGRFFKLLSSGLLIKMMPFIVKLLKLVILKGAKSLALTSNDKCNGCGICKNICPVDNIDIVDGKPVWSDHCVSCGACYHWCPKDALQMGQGNFNLKQYHHPESTIQDILNEKTYVNR